jgi:hypothetical protein
MKMGTDEASESPPGVWWGNSQIFALVAWMGQALAQQSWQAMTGFRMGQKGIFPIESIGGMSTIRNWQPWQGQHPFLDYYIYSSFTENPSNQCLIHSKEDCKKCLESCENALAGRVFDWVSLAKWGTGLTKRKSTHVGDAQT